MPRTILFLSRIHQKKGLLNLVQAWQIVRPSGWAMIIAGLACGVPVITTQGAPWQGLHTHRCGWWIDIGVEPLAVALREAMNLPPDTLRDMGRRGRAYVERDFGWPGIAQQMLSVYRWVLGQGEKPDYVMI